MGIQFYSQGGNPYSNQNANFKIRLFGTAFCKTNPKPNPKPQQPTDSTNTPKPVPKDSTIIKRDTIQPTYYGGWCDPSNRNKA